MWRPIPGFPHYEASTHGRIRALFRSNLHPGCIRKPNVTPEGYGYLTLTEDRKVYTKKVHRLVAMAWIPNPENKPQVRHLDGNPSNNHVGNLAWGTGKENAADSLRHGTNDRANKTHCKRGHEYAGDNLGYNARGGRICRTCTRRQGRESYYRLKAMRLAEAAS